MTDAAPWTCPTCRQVVSTAYCPTCGERQLHPRDLTLRGMLAQVAQKITSLDARLIRSDQGRLEHQSGDLPSSPEVDAFRIDPGHGPVRAG